MGRNIVIGDVHGCLVELTDLLAKLKPAKDDQLVFLGDLVNRGPDSHGVVSLVRSLPNALSLLGNHEARLLRYRKEREAKVLKDYDWETVRQLDEQDWKYLQGMKLTCYLPEFQTVCVHGGFLPDQPWEKQGADIVTRIQVIDEAGKPRKRTEAPLGRSWADEWKGPPFVIYGHTPRPDVYRRPWSLGLDTGCVYGGTLSACILPEREIVQVNAHRKYV
ncbi:MAG TPA: metallophosphoesterase [Opitutales bacterium]|nr:metallophosphoesterase [Opitutales bacterium]